MSEDQVAGLDGDWSEYPPAQQAAFALARKLTYEPHRITDADLDGLRKHYTDLQILEIIFSVSGNNSINRWKDGIGVPQEKDASRFLGRASQQPVPADRPLPIKSFLTPTPGAYQHRLTQVAPLERAADGAPGRLAVCRRPPLESRAEVEKALAACRKRTPRLPLVADDVARKLLPPDWPQQPLPQWVRLLANFPRDGKGRILSLRGADERGELSPLLKAQVSWIIARQDRAWYALGRAQHRLRQQGWSDDRIATLDGNWDQFTPAERAQFTAARRLAASPIVLTDQDVSEAVKRAGPRAVAQLIDYVAGRAFFDRITEAAGLRLED